MNQKHFLIKGTLLLTAAGMLAKFAGFYYKIFLSRTIGAEEIGLFQLTMPVLMICIALSSAGIQPAVTRFTAAAWAKAEHTKASSVLFCGTALSLSLSLLAAVILWGFAPWISLHFLMEKRCMQLIRIAAVSLPFAALHNCITGYFIGRKNVAVSAVSQLMEQFCRMAAVFFFYLSFSGNGRNMDASVMALGQIAGESAAAICTILALLFSDTSFLIRISEFRDSCHLILSMAVPMTLTRLLLCILQSMEAALLPRQLQQAGYSAADSLTVYGTLTGMTMPLLLFPTAITMALSTLLLPAVSEAQAMHQDRKIAGTVRASFYSSLLLGCFFMTVFLLFGRQMGVLLFHNPLAGICLFRLAVLCPFLYLNTTLGSVLHGLGKTAFVSASNLTGVCLRIVFLFFSVPVIGMNGYFLSMFITMAGITVSYLVVLRDQLITDQSILRQ